MHGPPRTPDSPRYDRRRGFLMLIVTSFFLIAGCQSAMSTQTATATLQHAGNSLPLRFKQHNFEAYCYNTQDCQVIYDETNHTRYATGKPTKAPSSADYRKSWGGASYLGIRNFPAPADVRWTALDGQQLEAKVDLGKIFADERVLHNVKDEDIPDNAFKGPAGAPNVFLEVNDRTITVYMKMLIPTKDAQIPGNANSYFRDDLMKAWSQTY